MAKTHATPASMTVKIVVNDKGNPAGKLADAELHFSDGPLAGLNLTNWLLDLGTPQRLWPQRDVSCAAVLGKRRATQLRVAATDHGYDGARGCSRSDRGICRGRGRRCCPAVTGAGAGGASLGAPPYLAH